MVAKNDVLKKNKIMILLQWKPLGKFPESCYKVSNEKDNRFAYSELLYYTMQKFWSVTFYLADPSEKKVKFNMSNLSTTILMIRFGIIDTYCLNYAIEFFV